MRALKLGPLPLWKYIVDHADIFEAHVLVSGYLNESDIKMFYECCRASRRAVIRAKIELRKRFYVQELSSISNMELAWEGFPWGETARLPSGQVITVNQEWFCAEVSATNDLKLLRWVREEKECAWGWKTSGNAAIQGNLDMMKYCVENGCEVEEGTSATAAKYGHLACLKYLRSKNIPWDERVCEQAREKNYIDVLTYAFRKKCPGYERYEQYISK